MRGDEHSAGDDDIDDFFQFEGAADPVVDVDFTNGPVPVPPRLGLLATLSHAEFDVVARSATLKFLEPDTVVFRQGEEADRFFILVDGAVEIERDGEVLATLGPGSFFGESALLVRGRRSATVRTLDGSAVWSVGYAAFEQAVSSHLMANDEVAREIQSRIQATNPEHFQ